MANVSANRYGQETTAFRVLISEDFWFGSLFSAIAVFFIHSDKFAENNAIAEKSRESQKSSLATKEKR